MIDVVFGNGKAMRNIATEESDFDFISTFNNYGAGIELPFFSNDVKFFSFAGWFDGGRGLTMGIKVNCLDVALSVSFLDGLGFYRNWKLIARSVGRIGGKRGGILAGDEC